MPKSLRILVPIMIFSMALIFAPTLAKAATTYTVDADFDQGSLINVVHTPSDQLQLTDQVEAFNFIWVANSGEGTIVKINTDTGAIVGEYRTSPNGTYGNPSRTTVDKDGSVWVGNRQAVSGNNAAITHVGLLENGQCEDRNGNGIIDTSTGLNDVKDWTDESGTRGVATAQDECIVHFTPIESYDARHISVDSANNIWVSGISNRTFFYIVGGKYNIPNSGTIVRTETGIGYGGYGGLISGDVIWSANPLLRWDTNYPLSDAAHHTTYSHDSYGLCEDSQGNVWNTSLSGGVIRKFNPAGDLLGTYSYGASNAQGCVVDGNDDVWVAHSLWGNSVGHLLNDGTLVGVIPVGNGPTGVAVDHNGKIWVTHYSSPYTVKRIDPTLGDIGGGGATIGAVDYTSVDLGGSLYNYSDMTGSTLSGKAESGTWTVVYDSQATGPIGDNISWTADVPNDGNLTVSIALSDDGATYGIPATVTNGQDISALSARYYKITVSFERGGRGVSPILYDLSLSSPYCGDGIANQETEECDGTDGVGGHQQCTRNCTLENLPYCGDGIKNANEQCDGSDGVNAGEVCTAECTVTAVDANGPILTITKTVRDSKVAPTGTATYTVTVTNTGAATAENVKLHDILPINFTFADNGIGTHDWDLGDLTANESTTVSYVVNISENANQGTYENIAVASADNYGNVSTKVPVQIEFKTIGKKAPSLTITKTADKSLANPASTVGYTVTIANNGDAPAFNVVLKDTLPAGFVFDDGATTRTWTLGDLAPTEKKIITYFAKVDASAAAAIYDNVAVVTADNVDDISAVATVEVRTVQVLGAETDPEAVLPVTGGGFEITLLVAFTLISAGALLIVKR
ncbi:MAG: hypothetical protein WCV50_02660 [Patescibacteria group bacterium]